VARLALGLAVSRVWIADNAGRTEHPGDVTRPFEHAVAALAGATAVHHLLPDANATFGADNDYRNACDALRRINTHPTALAALLDNAYHHVDKLVQRHAGAIRAIADVLLECPVLSGKRVERLYRAAHPERYAAERWPVSAYS
jgi:hypothetical protein